MRISFSPRRMDGALTLSREGDVLSINGETFDFSALPDGATLPAGAIASDWIVGPVERIGGVLHLTVILPHGARPSPAVAYPEPVIVTADGPIAVPFDPTPEPEDA